MSVEEELNRLRSDRVKQEAKLAEGRAIQERQEANAAARADANENLIAQFIRWAARYGIEYDYVRLFGDRGWYIGNVSAGSVSHQGDSVDISAPAYVTNSGKLFSPGRISPLPGHLLENSVEKAIASHVMESGSPWP